MAACVGTRDDEELKELFDNAESFDLSFFSNNTVAEFVKHFISTGTLHDARVLQMRLKRLLGNATFLQAFQHSGTPLAPAQPYRQPSHYLTSLGDGCDMWRAFCTQSPAAASFLGQAVAHLCLFSCEVVFARLWFGMLCISPSQSSEQDSRQLRVDWSSGLTVACLLMQGAS